jgi:hypothetical protein
MSTLPPEEEQRKRSIYDNMSARGRKRIDRIGYDKWDPFLEPKDPSKDKVDRTKRTTKDLLREFFQQHPTKDYSNAYAQGAFECAFGMVNDDDRLKGAYEFSLWYHQLLQQEGITNDE